MPYTEYTKWIDFFKKRPVGWREDQRTYLFLKTQGVKAEAEDIFPTLKMLKIDSQNYQEPDKAIPKGKFLEKMIKARSGDGTKLNIG